jgi:hypothetical protein
MILEMDARLAIAVHILKQSYRLVLPCLDLNVDVKPSSCFVCLSLSAKLKEKSP